MVRVCCPHAGCGAFQGAIQMFKSYGMEPGIHADGEGHYLLCHWPKHLDEAGLVRFAHDMLRKTNTYCSCGRTWTRRGGKVFVAKCKRCGTELQICAACHEAWDSSCPGCDEE